MLWLFFAVASAVAIAGYRVVTRHLMKAHSPYAFALLVNVIGTFFTLPFALTDNSWGELPISFWPWFLVATSTILWSLIMVLAFSTLKYLPVSRREQINQVEIIFVLLLGALFLGESLSTAKFVGAALVIIGALIASVGRTSIYKGWRSKGVGLTVVVAALYALVTIVDKAALQYFSTGTYTFMLYLFPGLLLAAFLTTKRRRNDALHLIERKRWVVLGATALSVIGYYLGLRAYALTDATIVYPVLKVSVIFAVVGGLLFFREERVQVVRKLVSAALVVAGAVVIVSSAWF